MSTFWFRASPEVAQHVEGLCVAWVLVQSLVVMVDGACDVGIVGSGRQKIAQEKVRLRLKERIDFQDPAHVGTRQVSKLKLGFRGGASC